MNNLIENNDNTAMLNIAELPVHSIYLNAIIIRDEAVFNIVYNNSTSGIVTVECGDQLWLLQDVEECVVTTFDCDDYDALVQSLAEEEDAQVGVLEYDRPDLDDHEYLINQSISLEEILGHGDYKATDLRGRMYYEPNPELVGAEVYTLSYDELMNAGAY